MISYRYSSISIARCSTFTSLHLIGSFNIYYTDQTVPYIERTLLLSQLSHKEYRHFSVNHS